MFVIMVENLRTGLRVPAGFAPCSHASACVLMSKMTKHAWRRIYLQPVTAET